MARRTVTRTIVARSPSPTIRIAAPAPIARRYGRRVRHYAGRAGRAVASEKHTMAALAAAGVYGLIEKSGVAIPTIGPLGPAATIGLGAWLYGRVSKNQTAQHIATGLLAVAVNRWAATGTIAGSDYND
jgi:S1-C subfamily serine protease